MLFVDTNSLLTTKPHHFEISNFNAILKGMSNTVPLGRSFGVVRIFVVTLGGFLCGPTQSISCYVRLSVYL